MHRKQVYDKNDEEYNLEPVNGKNLKIYIV